MAFISEPAGARNRASDQARYLKQVYDAAQERNPSKALDLYEVTTDLLDVLDENMFGPGPMFNNVVSKLQRI